MSINIQHRFVPLKDAIAMVRDATEDLAEYITVWQAGYTNLVWDRHGHSSIDIQLNRWMCGRHNILQSCMS